MSIAEHALPYVRAISPYVPGKPIGALAREFGLEESEIVKLASNENPHGMSPKARAAVAAALQEAYRYPDPFELVAKLARLHGVAANQIVLGNGSNDVLDIAARVFLAPGRSAVISQYAFAVYPIATQTCGAETIVASAHHYGHDLAAMRAALRSDVRMIWIANPNNPTGTFLPFAAIYDFLKTLPRDVAVVLDQAYDEYLAPEERVETSAWIAEFPHLIITRTFSKIHGLAGLRVGYAVASADVADLMNRVRQPFNVNNLAIVAALAACEDHAFLAESYLANRQGMQQIIAGLKRLGLEHIPSHGNFVTFAVPDGARVNQRLLRQGVIVRPLAGYGLPNHLRVTIGTERENARFLAALEEAIR
ncbi:MAG: histidinol-phosphate transaminase [Rhodocyclaceae bacterium]|nr:histidinol-phosphate transaminase [Rhodocyclaceae bacterium]